MTLSAAATVGQLFIRRACQLAGGWGLERGVCRAPCGRSCTRAAATAASWWTKGPTRAAHTTLHARLPAIT